MKADGAGAARERKALDILARIVSLPVAVRGRLLDEACGDDAALRADVESLLREDDAASELGAPSDGLAGPVRWFDIGGVTRRVAGEALAEGEREPSFPARIGRFRVIGPLGEGGMGIVLEAEQDEPRRRVAVKVLSRLAASPKAQRRFEREADIMAQLAHPAIARVFEAGRFDSDLGSQPYLAMELVDGEPLTAFAKKRSLPLRERVELLAGIAEAVEHAHAHGVVHRDLKPANILVTPAGRPKILDFGVARAQDVSGERTEPMTATGQMIGTLAYMSPEQVAGGAAVDAQSDVHALGVVLYELLVGRLPFELEGLPLVEAARVLRDEDPPRPGSLVPELRGDLEAVILCALAKDRARRYPTAAALAADLRRWLDGEPVLARREGPLARSARFVRRNAALSATVGALILTLVAGLVAVSWQAARATHLASEERRRAYVADIHAAAAAFDTIDSRSARRHLDEAPAMFRDWEWRYLASRFEVAERALHLPGVLRSVVMSADGGSIIALANAGPVDGRAQAWDAATGAPLGDRVMADAFRAACFDASGRPLALAVHERALSLMDLSTGMEAERCALEPLDYWWDDMHPAAIALGGALVAVPLRPFEPGSGVDVVTWLPATGEIVRRLHFEGKSPKNVGPTAIALAPSGRQLAASTYSGDIHVVTLDGTQPTFVLEGLTQQPVLALAFSPDERWLLLGGQDNSAFIVDLQTRAATRSLDGHRGPVAGVAWSHDGSRAFTASEDHVLRAWDARTGRLVDVLMGHEASVTCVVTGSDGSRMVSGAADGSVRTWILADTARPRVLRGHESFVYPVAWSPDGKQLWSGSWDGTVRAWDPATGAAVGAPMPFGVPVIALAASPDGSLLAVSVAGPDTLLMDTRTGRKVGALGPLDRRTAAVAFSPDGRLVATVSWDNHARLWDVATQRVVGDVDGLQEMYRQSVPVAYSPDGRTLAIPWGYSDVRLLDLPSLRVRATLAGHAEHVNAIAFSRDGALVATGSDDSTARTWDAATGRSIAVLSGHAAKVHAVAFNAESTRLATGSKDGTVRLWDPLRGDDLLVLEGHRDYVYSVAFSPDGAGMATGSGDGTVRIWEAPLSVRAAAGAP